MKFVPFCPVYSSARLKREAGSHKNFKKSCEILRECRNFSDWSCRESYRSSFQFDASTISARYFGIKMIKRYR